MKSSVFIKSFSNGINVYLDPKMDFSRLVDQVEERFRESSGFFKNAKMALSFDGRKLSEDEETILIERISQCCDLRITCLVGHDDEKDQTYLRAVQKVDALFDDDHDHERHGSRHRRSEGKSSGKKGSEFYRDSVKEQQRIEVPGNIVILGDVSAGSSVMAQGDIIVMGGLYGEAHAGCDMKDGHFVAALEMAPEALSICDIPMDEHEASDRWPIKQRPLPKLAFIQDEEVYTEIINRELWKELLNA